MEFTCSYITLNLVPGILAVPCFVSVDAALGQWLVIKALFSLPKNQKVFKISVKSNLVAYV